MSDSDRRRSLEIGASTLAAAGEIEIAGRGEGTSATRGADSSASRTLRALWITEGELVAVGALASLEVGLFLSTVWSAGLLVSKAVRLRPLGSGAVVFESPSGFGVAVVAIVEAVCAGVSMSKAAVSGCVGSLVTGGLGASFLVATVGEAEEEDAASGDTGGLPLLAFRAASLGECLRLGGIGVPDF